MRVNSMKATALAALRITAMVIIIAGMVAGITFSVAELQGAGRFTQIVTITEPLVARQATATQRVGSESQPERPPAVIVNPGDTLWQIASANYPGEHTGKMVYEIRQVNPGIDPGKLRIGQVVKLP